MSTDLCFGLRHATAQATVVVPSQSTINPTTEKRSDNERFNEVGLGLALGATYLSCMRYCARVHGQDDCGHAQGYASVKMRCAVRMALRLLPVAQQSLYDPRHASSVRRVLSWK